MGKAVAIIIPTYNERENIAPLVERIARALAGYDYEIVFIDDDSRDGTAGEIGKLKSSYPIRLMVRKNEKGLASAVVHGIRSTDSDTIAVMDADLQHPPELLPALLERIAAGADMAVGSRYVAGGGCQGWRLSRRIISAGAGFLAHLFLPVTRTLKDPMSGFFAFRRAAIDPAVLRPSGYKILLEILVSGRFGKVVEVPYIFISRRAGTSKLDARQQMAYLRHLFDLMRRKGELARFLKFCLVGASGVGVNLGAFWLLTRLAGLKEADFLALALSIETSIISNFLLNEWFTFRDRRNRDRLFLRFLKFNLICLAGAAVQAGIYAFLYHGLGIYDLVADFLGIVIATLWNYLLNTWFTWR